MEDGRSVTAQSHSWSQPNSQNNSFKLMWLSLLMAQKTDLKPLNQYLNPVLSFLSASQTNREETELELRL